MHHPRSVVQIPATDFDASTDDSRCKQQATGRQECDLVVFGTTFLLERLRHLLPDDSPIPNWVLRVSITRLLLAGDPAFDNSNCSHLRMMPDSVGLRNHYLWISQRWRDYARRVRYIASP